VLVQLSPHPDKNRSAEVRDRLQSSGRDVLDLTAYQISEFAGNAIELQGQGNRILALSARAMAALTPVQKRTLEKSIEFLPLHIPTIELAGGSVRCMLAGIHLSPRQKSM
jgi:hypothetical protein